jgi:excisionase family DNA binding protein
MTGEPAAGICGGEKSLDAYLLYMGVESLEELEEDQLRLFPMRSPHEDERPPKQLLERLFVSDRLVTASELAEHVGLKPGTVLDKWERGEWPGYKFGRAVRFDLEEILALGRREGTR